MGSVHDHDCRNFNPDLRVRIPSMVLSVVDLSPLILRRLVQHLRWPKQLGIHKTLQVPAARPDIQYSRTDRRIVPSWSGTQQYLNAEHEKIGELTAGIAGWQSQGDAYKLYEIAYHAGDVMLEIGTYSGKSAVIEILGSRANPHRKRTRWFGIDLNPDAVHRTQATLATWNLTPHAHLFQGDLRAFIEAHVISPSMVFVDGDHSYAGVKQDIALLSKFLGRDVPVLFHDYLNPNTEGVQRACDEWEKTGHVEFLGCFGCSALFVTIRGRPGFVSLWRKFKSLFGRRKRRC
jgi:hypothetical protein